MHARSMQRRAANCQRFPLVCYGQPGSYRCTMRSLTEVYLPGACSARSPSQMKLRASWRRAAYLEEGCVAAWDRRASRYHRAMSTTPWVLPLRPPGASAATLGELGPVVLRTLGDVWWRLLPEPWNEVAPRWVSFGEDSNITVGIPPLRDQVPVVARLLARGERAVGSGRRGALPPDHVRDRSALVREGARAARSRALGRRSSSGRDAHRAGRAGRASSTR